LDNTNCHKIEATGQHILINSRILLTPLVSANSSVIYVNIILG